MSTRDSPQVNRQGCLGWPLWLAPTSQCALVVSHSTCHILHEPRELTTCTLIPDFRVYADARLMRKIQWACQFSKILMRISSFPHRLWNPFCHADTRCQPTRTWHVGESQMTGVYLQFLG